MSYYKLTEYGRRKVTKVAIINLEERKDRRRYLEQSGFGEGARKGLTFNISKNHAFFVFQRNIFNHLGNSNVDVMWLSATSGSNLPPSISNFNLFPNWKLSYDQISNLTEKWKELEYEDMNRTEISRYYGREITNNEIGCFHSHWRVWEAIASSDHKYVVILEDDACSCVLPCWSGDVHTSRWNSIFETVHDEISSLELKGIEWDVILLGRNQFGDDAEQVTENLYRAGFSSCMHSYVVSKRGAQRLAEVRTIMPADDLVPALYATHPRDDVNHWARGQQRLDVFTFGEDLVVQLKSVALSIDENDWLDWHRPGIDCGIQPLFILSASDIDRGEFWGQDNMLLQDIWTRACTYAGKDAFDNLVCCNKALAKLNDEAPWFRLLCKKDPDLSPRHHTVSFSTSWRDSALGVSAQGKKRERCGKGKKKRMDVKSRLPGDIIDVVSASCGQGPIAVRNYSELSYPTFCREFESKKPVLIKNISTAPAWTIQSLVERYGADRTFFCQTQGSEPNIAQLTMRDFQNYCNNNFDPEPLYLFEHENIPEEIFSECPIPHYFEDDLLELSAQDESVSKRGVLGERKWLAIGCACSGSRWHTDPFQTSAWNVVSSGRKLWCFAPPDSPSPPVGVTIATEFGLLPFCDAPPAVDWFQILYDQEFDEQDLSGISFCVQQAGDCMFVPAGWWHTVVNLEDTVAFTQNYVPKVDRRKVIESLSDPLSLQPEEVLDALRQTAWGNRFDSSDDET